MVPPPSNRNPVDKALAWIRFGAEGNRNIIHEEGWLDEFNVFVDFTKSYIRDTASGFSRRNTAQGHINFGMRRVKYNLGIMHWAQGESHCYCMAYLTGISDTEE